MGFESIVGSLSTPNMVCWRIVLQFMLGINNQFHKKHIMDHLDCTNIPTLYASTASGCVLVCHSAWNSKRQCQSLLEISIFINKVHGWCFCLNFCIQVQCCKKLLPKVIASSKVHKPLVQCSELMGGKHHQQVLPHHIRVMSSHVNLCYIWVSYWPCSLLMCSLCIERLHKTIHVCLSGLPPWTMSDPLMNLPPNQP